VFIALQLQDPFWLIWFGALVLLGLIVLYSQGVLLIVVGDRYYGATDTRFFTDVTDIISCDRK